MTSINNKSQYNESKYIYQNKPVYEFIKTSIDFVLALVLLIIFSPIFIFVILIMYLFYGGKPFYLQERVGRNKKNFWIIKFRTMRLDAELDKPVWAVPNDSRCTSFGKILRKTSIDELPQLINILKCEMSFVGPRPERPYFLNDHIGLTGKRLLVKPGLTGLAQVNGRYSLTIEEKLKFDLEYIHNRSLWLDFKILIKTIPVVLSCKNSW
ncbi:MAG TPA: sugar transferase [bacterium]|nr:sugar transferase [bacterium]HPP88742.1 sugar transferase [bacterium]